MKLTSNQQRVLDELRRIGRENAFRWRGRESHLHKQDLARLGRGDQAAELLAELSPTTAVTLS